MFEPRLVREPGPQPFWPPELPRPRMRARGALATFLTRFEPGFRHGPWCMREVLRRPAGELAQLAGRGDGPLSWGSALFLDLESGVHPRGGPILRLAGLGRLGDGGLKVCQYAALSPDGEREVLDAVARDAGRATDLVTFAGRSFDAPLLVERARALGVRLALPRRHFDLYRMSVKLLRRRFEDARLITLERELLRFERAGDLPGAAVPRAWAFESDEAQDALLWAVVRHNLLDVLSLPALAAELALRLECPQEQFEQARLDEREGRVLEAQLQEARRALEAAPSRRLEAARRRVRRLEKKLAELRGEDGT
jgi:hypothetical protein